MKPKARKEDLLVEEIGEELVVFDLLTDRAHRLNRTSTLVWKLANGETEAAAIAGSLRERLHPEADEDLVRLTVQELTAAGLLLEAPAVETAVVDAARRRFMRRVSLVGTLSVLLPVVLSVLAPTPAMAVSNFKP